MLNDRTWPARQPRDGAFTAMAMAHDPGPEPAAGEAKLDDAALARLRELDPTGTNKLLERVFKAFESSVARLMPLLAEAERVGNPAGIGHVAHTLKSSSASIGAVCLSQLCAEVESKARLGSVEGLSGPIELMRRETARVLRALRQLPGGRP
jgi:HPt (histidine-containing phosphotransfer) domain-containing protein